jgi:hypothetical protein
MMLLLTDAWCLLVLSVTQAGLKFSSITGPTQSCAASSERTTHVTLLTIDDEAVMQSAAAPTWAVGQFSKVTGRAAAAGG